jgi:hypothetical protein
MTTVETQPSEKSQIILSALKKAVTHALEKKRKLGQYAVVWEDDKVVYKGEDAPKMDSVHKAD